MERRILILSAGAFFAVLFAGAFFQPGTLGFGEAAANDDSAPASQSALAPSPSEPGSDLPAGTTAASGYTDDDDDHEDDDRHDQHRERDDDDHEDDD